MKATLSTLLLVLVLVGCMSNPAVDSAAIEPVAPENAVDLAIYGNPERLIESTTVEKRREMFVNAATVFHNLNGEGTDYASLLRSNAPLREKDAAVKALLDSHPGDEWLHLRQTAATPMLDMHLRHGSTDLDAIDRYARVLVEAENPSADLLSPALEMLRGRWTASEIQSAAATSFASASSWQTQNCADCATKQGVSESNDTDVKRSAIAEALPTLRTLSRT